MPLSRRCMINSDLFLFGFFFYMVMKGIAHCGYVLIAELICFDIVRNAFAVA